MYIQTKILNKTQQAKFNNILIGSHSMIRWVYSKDSRMVQYLQINQNKNRYKAYSLLHRCIPNQEGTPKTVNPKICMEPHRTSNRESNLEIGPKLEATSSLISKNVTKALVIKIVQYRHKHTNQLAEIAQYYTYMYVVN